MEYINKHGAKIIISTAAAAGATLCSPGTANASALRDIAFQTFAPGGPGALMFQFTLIGIVGWLLNYLLHAINKGAFADLVRVAALLACIGMIAALAYNTLLTIARIAGLG